MRRRIKGRTRCAARIAGQAPSWALYHRFVELRRREAAVVPVVAVRNVVEVDDVKGVGTRLLREDVAEVRERLRARRSHGLAVEAHDGLVLGGHEGHH